MTEVPAPSAAGRIRHDDALYRLLVQGVTDYAICMLDPGGRVISWNAGAERAKGYRAEEILGRHFSRFYTEEDRAIALPQQALATVLLEGRFEGEGWRCRRDGSRFWAHVVIDPIRDESSALIGFAKITRDRTEYRRQSDKLRRITATLDLALANMSQGLCLFDGNERLLLANDRCREKLGLEEGALATGATLTDFLWLMLASPERGHAATAAAVREARAAHLAQMGGAIGTVTNDVAWHGRALVISHRALPDGGWVSTIDDVTDRRRIEDRIRHLAHHDTLTELPNRVTFHARLCAALAGEAVPAPCALLHIDLDRFKPVNDTLGHAAGDAVLLAIAARIRAQLRPHDAAARLGGDEFATLMADCGSLAEAGVLADRLIRDIARPIAVEGHQVVIGASIGIALAPQHGLDPDLLLRNADLALYRAKEAGRGCHRIYEPGMELVVQQRGALERDLRAALADGEFALHYQPIVDTGAAAVTGFEALLRWTSRTRGQVPPAAFIPFAEEIGLMAEIGDWVLRTACREAAAWPHALKVSVNLSPTQFRQPDLAARVAEALRESGLPAARLELELTETAMIDDLPRATAALHALRNLGVDIAMDDFGTGFSSLSFLHTLPFTRIKIDRSFVRDLGVKPEAVAIIRAVTRLCDGLGVSATAEGVETERQRDMLRAEGCREMQGLLIGAPVPAAEVPGWRAAPGLAGTLPAPDGHGICVA